MHGVELPAPTPPRPPTIRRKWWLVPRVLRSNCPRDSSPRNLPQASSVRASCASDLRARSCSATSSPTAPSTFSSRTAQETARGARPSLRPRVLEGLPVRRRDHLAQTLQVRCQGNDRRCRRRSCADERLRQRTRHPHRRLQSQGRQDAARRGILRQRGHRRSGNARRHQSLQSRWHGP